MTGLSGFNTAVSGLNAAQRAIEVTAQNIANANTPGYSRQQVLLSSVGTTTAAHFYTGGNAAILGGVQIDAVLRVRDTFLETARVNAGATKALLDIQATTLNGVEGLLNEPGDDGLQAVIDDFYSAWHEVASSPGTDRAAAGAQVLQAGSIVAAQLRFVASGVSERWDNAKGDLDASVKQLNQAASDLAGVNQKILEGTVAERPISELLDRRDSLIRTIGELAGGRAVIDKNNTATVLIDNITIVSGSRSLPVATTGATAVAEADTDPPKLMRGEVNVPISSGKIAGLLSVLGNDVPKFANQLDAVANALKDAVNAVHSTGYALDGSTGIDFFSGTGAFNLAVLVDSADGLALSSGPDVVDGSIAEKIADLALDENSAEALGGAPGPSVLLRALAADIGTKLQGSTGRPRYRRASWPRRTPRWSPMPASASTRR